MPTNSETKKEMRFVRISCEDEHGLIIASAIKYVPQTDSAVRDAKRAIVEAGAEITSGVGFIDDTPIK